jgi:hypothetical protein
MRVNEPPEPIVYVFRVAEGGRQGLQFIEAKSKRQAEHRTRREIVEFVGTLAEFVHGIETDQFEQNVFLEPNSDRAVGWQWWR